MLNAAQVETCTEPLLREGRDAARELDVPIHTHAGGNLIEFQQIMGEYRKTPIQFLADIGFLDDRTPDRPRASSPAAIRGRGHPFGDDVRVLAERGATVGHCPYKYAKMAMTLRSFQRYLDAGVTIALGTDTFPLDIVSELRWASILAKTTDGNYQAGQHRDVFNAATLGRLPLPAPRRPRPPGAGRQGRHPPDHARPPGRGHVRGSRSRRWSTPAAGATCTP